MKLKGELKNKLLTLTQPVALVHRPATVSMFAAGF